MLQPKTIKASAFLFAILSSAVIITYGATGARNREIKSATAYAAKAGIAEHSLATTHDRQTSAPEEDRMRSASGKYRRYEKQPGKVQPLLPVVDQPDIRENDKKLLNEILMWLPSFCRNNIKNLVVRYDSKAPRGESTSSVILVRGGMPRKETISVMSHECGHIADLGYLRGNQDSGTSPYPDGYISTFNDDPSVGFYAISWRDVFNHRAGAKNNDFVSGYAASDPFEDFAESFVLYALHNDLFYRMALKNPVVAEKYDFMKNIVFDGAFKPLRGNSGIPPAKRVWDITKLPHEL